MSLCTRKLPTISALCLGRGLRLLLELLAEGHLVEEGPGVVELVIPSSLQISHSL